MKEETEILKQDRIKVIPIGPGEAHIQNKVIEQSCYICRKKVTNDMVLLRIKQKQMGFSCIEHSGVLQEFIRQYKRIPIGWKIDASYSNKKP